MHLRTPTLGLNGSPCIIHIQKQSVLSHESYGENLKHLLAAESTYF